MDTVSGLRARSMQIRGGNNVFHIINIGVSEDHPMADRSQPPQATGLHGIRIGGIPLPAPQFMFASRTGEAESQEEQINTAVSSVIEQIMSTFSHIFSRAQQIQMRFLNPDMNEASFMGNF